MKVVANKFLIMHLISLRIYLNTRNINWFVLRYQIMPLLFWLASLQTLEYLEYNKTSDKFKKNFPTMVIIAKIETLKRIWNPCHNRGKNVYKHSFLKGCTLQSLHAHTKNLIYRLLFSSVLIWTCSGLLYDANFSVQQCKYVKKLQNS